jgi:uncharacterized protein (TIGR03067 family)
MLRTLVLALSVCLPLVAVCRADNNDKDAKQIEGVWQLKEAELAGRGMPARSIKSFRLTLKGGKYDLKSNEAPDKGTYKLDAQKKPRQITIAGTEGPNKGKTIPAIYEVSDDTLKVCYDLSGQAHPEEFKTKPGTQLFLATYKRDKP